MHDLLYIILTEVLMTPLIIYIIVYISNFFDTLGTRKISAILLILSMMSGMLNSIDYYLIFPRTFLNEVMAINISMFEMTVILSYVLISAFNGNLRRMTKTHAKWMSILVGWNEISMAILLYTLSSGFGNGNFYLNTINLFGAGITNYLFAVPMIIEMLILLYVRVHSGLGKRISISIILMQVSDPGLFDGQFAAYLTILFSLVMLFAIYYTISYVHNHRNELEPKWEKNIKFFIFLILFSAVGLIASVVIPGQFGVRWIIFAVSMAYSTIYYFMISFRFFDSSTPEGIRKKALENS